jgi:putative effector of murein hydrolase
MDYLIDPKVFYWMSVLTSLDFFLVFMGIIFLIILAVVIVIYVTLKLEGEYYEDEVKIFEKFLKPIPIILALVLFLGVPIFIPSKDTMKQMLVASQITHENIEGVQQSATELVDYIVDKINEVEKED